jgi:hypothetical protein
MAIPTLRSVQPQINIVGSPDKFVREPRPAAGAEDDAGLTKRRVHRLVPPAGVTELDDVALCWIELVENRSQPRLCIAMTRWKLKEKAPHSLAQDIGDHAKIPYKRFRAPEPLDVSDELTDFDGVDEISFARLAPPGFDVRHRRPRIKGCIDFNRIEALRVVMKPFTGWQVVGIE